MNASPARTVIGSARSIQPLHHVPGRQQAETLAGLRIGLDVGDVLASRDAIEVGPRDDPVFGKSGS